ncbi:MAG: hypothetical protein HYS57_01290 [Parcubacteria group bacterium]|nr:hypothetical protein [Parcubacteria group bacterium]
MAHTHRKKTISELRQDPVSGDWIVIATGRAKRWKTTSFKQKKKRAPIPPRSTCPFEDPQKTGHGLPLLMLDRKGKEMRIMPGEKPDWFVQIVTNKYPAFGKGDCSIVHRDWPHLWLEGAGFHEVVIFRDHVKHMAHMTRDEIDVTLQAYQKRYQQLMHEDCVEYIMIYHNHGREAGASIFHPHSQIIANPVIPPDVGRSIKGSAQFYEKNRSCIHCAVIAAERKFKKRVIYENKSMVLLAPFASKVAFEVRAYPKRHAHAFEMVSSVIRRDVADVLKVALSKIVRGLGEPAYNFFIHTAPTRPEHFAHYHWHIEILPKTSIWAGFELGTGMEISSVAPEAAAAYLRKIKA